MTRRPWRAVCATGVVAALAAAGTAAATPGPTAAERVIGVVRGAHLGLHMTQSGNWSGYNQGVVEKGTTFHSISGEWVVPTAKQRVKGQPEFSSSWVGIGGGCLETSCALTDSTLIQAGTEQDVAANGAASYSTWYELIPAPSIQTPLTVRPGDVVAVSIAESLPAVWGISIRDVTTGNGWSTTVPYTSDYSTAEWIEETPVVAGTGGVQVGPMPALGAVHFDRATVNGAPAGLSASEAMQLVDANGRVLATPSKPDADTDGFDDCTYATSCSPPGSELTTTTTATSGKASKRLPHR